MSPMFSKRACYRLQGPLEGLLLLSFVSPQRWSNKECKPVNSSLRLMLFASLLLKKDLKVFTLVMVHFYFEICHLMPFNSAYMSNSELVTNLWAFHHYGNQDNSPINKHPELEKLLREEFRTIEDFKEKEKARKAAEKEASSSRSNTAAAMAASHIKAVAK